MKKTILLFALILTLNPVFAGPYTPTLGKIENVLYGFQYENETDDLRLDRIENTVYGNVSSGNVAQRITKLKNDLSADLMGQEITPQEDTFADKTSDYPEEIASDSNIQYPAVDELEQKVFNQKFSDKDIKQRLSALEEKTFGKSYSDDLASRVDRLKAEIKPYSFMDNEIAQSSNNFFDDDVIELERNYHLDRYESPNQFDYDAYNAAHGKNSFRPAKKANITTVENALLRRSYQNDAMENRLARLENTMFGTEFAAEDTQTRMNRISSAYKAQKHSSKYDSNKFSQNMSTAIQIGSMLLMILACIL